VPISDRRKHEDRQRGGRVFDPEIEVRHLAVDHGVAVTLVHRRVDDLAPPVEAVMEHGPGRPEHHQCDEPGRERDPALSR
jgi:hypothetical protein